MNDYFVGVYADAVEAGLRTLESVPDEYRAAVEEELRQRDREKA